MTRSGPLGPPPGQVWSPGPGEHFCYLELGYFLSILGFVSLKPLGNTGYY